METSTFMALVQDRVNVIKQIFKLEPEDCEITFDIDKTFAILVRGNKAYFEIYIDGDFTRIELHLNSSYEPLVKKLYESNKSKSGEKND